MRPAAQAGVVQLVALSRRVAEQAAGRRQIGGLGRAGTRSREQWVRVVGQPPRVTHHAAICAARLRSRDGNTSAPQMSCAQKGMQQPLLCIIQQCGKCQLWHAFIS